MTAAGNVASAKHAADDLARTVMKARVDGADMRDASLTVGNDGWTTTNHFDANFTAEERAEVERLAATLPRGEMQLRVMEGVVDRISGRPPDIFGWEPSLGPTGTTRLATCTTLPFDRAGVCAVLFALPLKPLRINVSPPDGRSGSVSADSAAAQLRKLAEVAAPLKPLALGEQVRELLDSHSPAQILLALSETMEGFACCAASPGVYDEIAGDTRAIRKAIGELSSASASTLTLRETFFSVGKAADS